MSRLVQIIKQIVEPMLHKQVLRGKILSVDKENDTCDIEPLRGGAEYLEVRLKAVIKQTDVKLVVYPVIGSIVHFGIIENNPADTYVTQITEFESVLITNKTLFKLHLKEDGKLDIEAKEITFNGGNNKGLVKEPELVKELNKNNQILQAILGVINGTPIPEAGNYAPSSLQTTLKGVLTGKQIGDFTQLENTKIKH